MGTVNGLVMGYIRMPYSLALRHGMMPGAKWLAQVDPRLQMPVHSACLAFGLCAFWMLVHYFCTRFGLLPNSDVSEIAIAISYLFYLLLYWRIYRMHRAGLIQSRAKGVVIPALAACGSLIILSGGLQSGWLFLVYLLICGLVVLASQLYYRRSPAQ